MSKLYIDGIEYSLFVTSIKQSASQQEEKHEFYSDTPSISSAFSQARRITIDFAIYDVQGESIARDLEAHFMNKSQFILWIEEFNIIQGYRYILAKPASIDIPRDSEKPNHIAGTMSVDVIGLGGDYGFVENNYVRIKLQENVWNLEGSS